MYKIVDRFISHRKRKIYGAYIQVSTYWIYNNVSITLFYWYKLQRTEKYVLRAKYWNGIWVLLFTAYISVGTSYFSSGFIIWKNKVEIISLWVMSRTQQVQKETKKIKKNGPRRYFVLPLMLCMYSPLVNMLSVHRGVVHFWNICYLCSKCHVLLKN